MDGRAAAAIVVALLLTGPAAAQTRSSPPPAQPQGPDLVPSAEPEFQSLGVSLDRIRRQLRELPPTASVSLIKLEYHIDVIGKMPPFNILQGFNIDKSSAVQYGGMTHAEFLKITAPPWRRW